MSIVAARVSISVSAASSSGVLTCSSTLGVIIGQIGNISKTGVISRNVQVTDILNGTSFRCRIDEPGYNSNNVFGDLSAFDGGGALFNAEEQVVGTPGGGVDSIIAGNNIILGGTSTNPIINASGGGGGSSSEWKSPCFAATTGPGNIATDFQNGSVVDGATLLTGDRLLIKNQADPTTNGIYVVASSGPPARSSDAASGSDLVGAVTYIETGTVNGQRSYVNTNTSIVLGVDPITFVLFGSSAGALLAANNLSDVANAATARGNLGLTIGLDVQPFNAGIMLKTDSIALYAARRARALLSLTKPPETLYDSMAALPGDLASVWTRDLGSNGTLTRVTGTGLARLDTSGTASSSAAIAASGNPETFVGSWAPDPNSGTSYALFVFRVPSGVDAQTKVLMGYVQGSGATVGIGINGAASTSNFRLYSGGSGVASAIAIDTNFHIAEVWTTGSGTMFGAIDGETPVSFSMGAFSPVFPWCSVTNGTTAASRKLDLDTAVYLVPSSFIGTWI